MMTAGFNLAVTIVNYRAPGMTWSRIPIFVWSILATCALLTLATPTLVAAGLFGILDHTAQTAFYVTEHGGSSFLWQNLFWFFGHPEVYIMALPGFGIVAELLPVFTRKPLFAYKVAAAGMVGVALLSFFVWQHHLFQSGINPDMRPLFMLTTELISIPTGFIFLVGMGTLYKAKIRFEVPMLFCLAVFFNFLIGGVTGVFLSDVPVNVTVHGSFFVLAHFHYTIMGGLIFAFFGGLYFWLPKMTGKTMNKKLGQIHFWLMFVFFNLTFFPMFLIGLLGQPRRVFEYASNLQALNDFASMSAFVLGASFLVFVANFVWSIFIKPTPSPANPWDSLGLEWQTPTPVPYYNFERIPVVLSDPYHYGEEDAPAVADLGDGTLVRRRSLVPGQRGRGPPTAGPMSGDEHGDRHSRQASPLHRDSRGAGVRTAVRGRLLLDRRPPADRDVHLPVRLAGLRLLLPEVGQLRAAVAAQGHHRTHRHRLGHLRRGAGLGPARHLRAVPHAQGLPPRLGGLRLGGRAGHPGGHRPPDLAAHPASLLPRLQRLRLLLHRVGGDEPDDAVRRPSSGSRPTWPCASGSSGSTPRTGTRPRRPGRRPSCSGPTSSRAPTSSVSWPWSAACSGSSST